MLLLEARQQVAHYGRDMLRRGLTTGTFGNLSVYVPEAKVMVGGAVLTQDFADSIGADYYSKDAAEAVKLAQRFFESED